jgi:hypothetical protein
VGQTSGMWSLPRVWRRERFIVWSPLVGDPARIWIASSQIAVRMLQFSYVDVRRRRSDSLRQRYPGMKRETDRDYGTRPCSLQASRRQSSRVAGSEHKIGQEGNRTRCSYGHCVMRGSRCLAGRRRVPGSDSGWRDCEHCVVVGGPWRAVCSLRCSRRSQGDAGLVEACVAAAVRSLFTLLRACSSVFCRLLIAPKGPPARQLARECLLAPAGCTLASLYFRGASPNGLAAG